MSSKSFDLKQMSISNPPSYSSYPRPPNPVNSYPSSSSSTSTWTSSNREWAVSSPMPNPSLSKYSNLPSLPNLQSSYPSISSSNRNWTAPPPLPNLNLSKYSSPSCPPNLMNSYPSSSSSTPTWTPSQREWTTSSPISGHGPSSNFSQLLTQANPYPQSSPTGSHFSPLQNRDFHNFSASQTPSLRGNDSSAVFQFLHLTPPQFSSKNSSDNFSFLHRAPSNGGFSSSPTLRSFMDREMSVAPTRFLPTMEDRAFQSFQKAMNADRPLSCSSTTISFRPPTNERSPLIINVASARFSNGVPHISTARISFVDKAAGLWNGTKEAFAYIGLNQMELDSQERMTIFDTLARTNQKDRSSFKESMLADQYLSGKIEHIKGANLRSTVRGTTHGTVDFMVNIAHDFQTAMFYLGSADMELQLEEKALMLSNIMTSQAKQMKAVEGLMMNLLSADQSDTVYQSFRSNTTFGLEVGSLVSGGYAAAKGVIAFNRLAKMPIQVARLSNQATSPALFEVEQIMNLSH